MSALGVLFAVGGDVIEQLRGMPLEERPVFISEELEELYFEDYPECTYELDKSWDAMHRALSDGTLSFDGTDPLSLAILGGEKLYFDDSHDDYIITAKTPEQVGEIAEALSAMTDEQFTERYNAISDDGYNDLKSPEDLEYTLEYLRDSIPFWRNAAKQGFWVLFTADQ